ncbi:MAG: OsmC family protein [Candidatus Omnitrophica bacterium]|nr:OsmC family protein [Candidatus Omnitrophota bacterium]
MVGAKSKKFNYKTTVEWKEQKKGMLSCSDKPAFEVATPVEFRGHAGIWTPEDLFVSSVNICVMTTFLFFAEKEGVELLSYKSDADGILEKVDDKFMFSRITLSVSISVKTQDQISKAQELLVRAEENCLISNSIVSKVTVRPDVKSGE